MITLKSLKWSFAIFFKMLYYLSVFAFVFTLCVVFAAGNIITMPMFLLVYGNAKATGGRKPYLGHLLTLMYPTFTDPKTRPPVKYTKPVKVRRYYWFDDPIWWIW